MKASDYILFRPEVLRMTTLTLLAKLVVSSIAYCCRYENMAVSNECFAEKYGVSTDAVAAAIAELVRKGLIIQNPVEGKQKECFSYEFTELGKDFLPYLFEITKSRRQGRKKKIKED